MLHNPNQLQHTHVTFDPITHVSQNDQVVNNVTANVFTKADFITYYEAVGTGRPLRWTFHASSGQPAQFEVMEWEENGVAEESEWQAPSYCFNSTSHPQISLQGGMGMSQLRLIQANQTLTKR